MKQKAIGTEISRKIFLKDKKLNSASDFLGSCYLGTKCKDKNCILIGLNSVTCKKILYAHSQKKNLSHYIL